MLLLLPAPALSGNDVVVGVEDKDIVVVEIDVVVDVGEFLVDSAASRTGTTTTVVLFLDDDRRFVRSAGPVVVTFGRCSIRSAPAIARSILRE